MQAHTLSPKRKEVFDTYRDELRSVRIIGSDELLKRIDHLIGSFETYELSV